MRLPDARAAAAISMALERDGAAPFTATVRGSAAARHRARRRCAPRCATLDDRCGQRPHPTATGSKLYLRRLPVVLATALEREPVVTTVLRRPASTARFPMPRPDGPTGRASRPAARPVHAADGRGVFRRAVAPLPSRELPDGRCSARGGTDAPG